MQKRSHPGRRRKDRRTRPTNPLSSSSRSGQRKTVRRREDRLNQPYVDRYSLRSVSIVVFILILSVTDAVFTLRLIGMGGKELNPVMDFFLGLGPVPFLLVKYLITGSCLLLFLIHKNRLVYRGRVSIKAVLIAVLFLYVLLIFYELTLLY